MLHLALDIHTLSIITVLFARTNGEEFAVVLPHTNLKFAVETAEGCGKTSYSPSHRSMRSAAMVPASTAASKVG